MEKIVIFGLLLLGVLSVNGGPIVKRQTSISVSGETDVRIDNGNSKKI